MKDSLFDLILGIILVTFFFGGLITFLDFNKDFISEKVNKRINLASVISADVFEVENFGEKSESDFKKYLSEVIKNIDSFFSFDPIRL
jgi:hypothetical protein